MSHRFDDLGVGNWTDEELLGSDFEEDVFADWCDGCEFIERCIQEECRRSHFDD